MPPRRADGTPRSPQDFSALLATAEPLLLVGGQAVNLWALYYHERTAGLEPFVSRNLDVLGTRETLDMIAKVAGTTPQVFPLRPPSHAIGVVIAKDAAGDAMLVEVLRSVNGLTNAELRATVYTVAVGDTRVQVPSPIALLQAKIANVVDLDQTGRQDARHVAILARLMPAHLADLRQAALDDRREERRLIDALERLLRVVRSVRAKKVLGQLGLDRRAFFVGLAGSELPKLRAFLEKRLPHAIGP